MSTCKVGYAIKGKCGLDSHLIATNVVTLLNKGEAEVLCAYLNSCTTLEDLRFSDFIYVVRPVTIEPHYK